MVIVVLFVCRACNVCEFNPHHQLFAVGTDDVSTM